jgi:integrase
VNKGKITTTKPLPLEVVERIKEHLDESPRELAWFILSTNSAFRGGDVLTMKKQDLRPLPGGWLEIQLRERKTHKLRTVKVHPDVAKALSRWLVVHPGKTDYVFEGVRGKMGTSVWGVKLRAWCAAVGYRDRRISTHSCRKTFVRTKVERGAKLVTLMHALNHSNERQVLSYCGIMADDVQKLYDEPI